MTWKWQRQRVSYMVILVACLSGIAIALLRHRPIFVSCNNEEQNFLTFSLPTTHLSAAQVQRLAEAITVKVLSNELLGSGTLIKREGQVYSVITNAHVIRAADSPYHIQTPDGRIYPATLSKTVFQSHDLALLQFRSTAVYAVAKMGNSATLAVGDKVFVGGFTLNRVSQGESERKAHTTPQSQLRLPNASPPDERGMREEFIFTTGQVSLVLNKALEGGYQIGYTNNIRKGMSGAPLLNHQGKVVGINGLHKDPLWEAPELYHDGSEPCKPLQDLITRSSLAVPIKTVVQLAP